MKNNQFKINKLLALTFLAAFFGACSSPKYLVSRSFRGDRKLSRIYLQESGVEVTEGSGKNKKKEKLYNAFVRICDIDEGKKSVNNCKDTMVLDLVTRDGIK